MGFNDENFSILNDPKEFINPTGQANPDMLAAPTMTPTAADSGGMDWNKIVQGIAMAGLSGIAAGRGDTMAGMRMTQLMGETERRNQDQKMQQEAHALNKEKHELTIGELQKKDKARAAIREMDMEEFGKDPSGAMIKVMPHLIDLNPDAAASVFNAAVKARSDEKASNAAVQASKLIQAATGPDGTIDSRKVAAGMATITDPEVNKALKDFVPFLLEQGRDQRAAETNERLVQNQKDSNEKFLISQDRLRDSMAQSASQFQQGQSNQNARFNAAQAGMESRLDRRLALTEEQQRRLTPTQVKEFTGHQTTLAAINHYESAYNDLLKETNGKFSAVFKGALAKNAKARTLAELSGITGGTPAEQKFAAEYTAMVSNLRNITTEMGVLTDVDAARILGSFDPAQTPGQVKANLLARRGTHERNANAMMDSLEKIGKNVTPLRTPAPATTPAATAPASTPAATPAQAPAARPRAVNKQTGEVMEWDGKAWVKVK